VKLAAGEKLIGKAPRREDFNVEAKGQLEGKGQRKKSGSSPQYRRGCSYAYESLPESKKSRKQQEMLAIPQAKFLPKGGEEIERKRMFRSGHLKERNPGRII